MMFFGHRKLLVFSQVSLHTTNRILVVVKKSATCSCYFSCPLDCQNSSFQDDNLLPPPPASQKNNNMPTILILMLCILGAVLVFLCYLTIVKRYRTNLSHSVRRNSVSAEEIQRQIMDHHHPIWYIQTVGLEQSVIDSIAVFRYKKGEGLVEGADCSVCLSEFEDDESLRLLPKCSHAFHVACIDTWLRSHKNCPLCRAPIVRDTNNISTTDTDAMQSVLDNSVSREDTLLRDDQPENDDEVRVRVENIGPLSNEEGKILEMVRRNSTSIMAGKNRVRVLSDLADRHVRFGEELQPVRRSVSMDSTSASMIYAAVAKIHPVKDEGCSSIQDVEVKKQTLESDTAVFKQGNKNLSFHRSRKSFSFGRSLQSVPIRMKRSFSSSGKFRFPDIAEARS
ncbi:hypothetical protein ACH5RR_012248 [Cinchona calisaya]|uniref:RING-type E3 ubiquitin transferase n=1 Tax=Cinchona calisaya TaxID=153742 RepID=A0ABD3A794_9GENT